MSQPLGGTRSPRLTKHPPTPPPRSDAKRTRIDHGYRGGEDEEEEEEDLTIGQMRARRAAAAARYRYEGEAEGAGAADAADLVPDLTGEKTPDPYPYVQEKDGLDVVYDAFNGLSLEPTTAWSAPPLGSAGPSLQGAGSKRLHEPGDSAYVASSDGYSVLVYKGSKPAPVSSLSGDG